MLLVMHDSFEKYPYSAYIFRFSNLDFVRGCSCGWNFCIFWN